MHFVANHSRAVGTVGEIPGQGISSTLNLARPLTVPKGAKVLITLTGPVVAVAGTVACSSVGDTNDVAAATPLNLTTELLLNPTPSTVTTVPAGAPRGLRPVVENVGTNALMLVALPGPRLTVIADGRSPFGTAAQSCVRDKSFIPGAISDPNLTTMPGASADPMIVIVLPVIPERGVNEAILGGP